MVENLPDNGEPNGLLVSFHVPPVITPVLEYFPVMRCWTDNPEVTELVVVPVKTLSIDKVHVPVAYASFPEPVFPFVESVPSP